MCDNYDTFFFIATKKDDAGNLMISEGFKGDGEIVFKSVATSCVKGASENPNKEIPYIWKLIQGGITAAKNILYGEK